MMENVQAEMQKLQQESCHKLMAQLDKMRDIHAKKTTRKEKKNVESNI